MAKIVHSTPKSPFRAVIGNEDGSEVGSGIYASKQKSNLSQKQKINPSERAGIIVRRFEQLKRRRSSWETHWQDIADHVLPQRDFLNDAPHAERGEKRTRRLFDSTAPLANDLLASALAGMLTNPALSWFTLRPQDLSLEEKPKIRQWLDLVRNRMMAIFADPDANFYPQIHEVYKDLIGFGTAVFYVGDEAGAIRFQARTLAEVYIAEDARGRIDTVFRHYWMSARQAEQRWGDQISATIQAALEKDPDHEIAFLHAVMPATEWGENQAGKQDPIPYRFKSLHVEIESGTLLMESGFHEFPFQVPRWSKMIGEVYGRSPAMLALADIRMVNAMSETLLKAAQKTVDPPLQVPHDGFMAPLNLTPGAVNFYDPTAIGRGGGIQTINVTGKLELGLEMMEQRRQTIRAAHLVDQLQSESRTGVTATEIMQRAEEKLRVLGPAIGRLQAELLSPVIKRSFAILERQQSLPPRPAALRDQSLEIQYVAPIVRRQKLSEASGLMQLIDIVGFAARLDPAAAQVIDAQATVRFMAEALALPPSLIRDQESVAKQMKQQPGAETTAAGNNPLATLLNSVVNAAPEN